ncbi:peptidylprolyl isomerase [uncultured Methanolobus sp.]|uniref:FKBP-type peptidyl-prolyl cis-trans isomerase n=1 Tax=uncultured Methanolobus sp. TaxID=218300 RepID=UPI0029C8B8C9|nr:peptidylprolyl isomerase [uncultured Methanolobus sp.]
MAIKDGDTIKVDYTGTLEDGSIFDSSEGRQPLEFTVGSGQVIKGFDDAVKGMEVGGETEITLAPVDAYGEHKTSLVDTVSRDLVQSNDMVMEIGKTFFVQTPHGEPMPAKVVDLTDDEVTFDLNHPLAGKALTFKIKVVEA